MITKRSALGFVLPALIFTQGASSSAYELVTHAKITDEAFKSSQGVAVYLDDLLLDPTTALDFASHTDPGRLAGFDNTGTPRDWLIEGAIREDDFVRILDATPLINDTILRCPVPENPPTPISRVYNHFLNAQAGGRGLTLDPDGLVPLGVSASDWARTHRPNPQDNQPNQFSVLDARTFQVLSLTAAAPVVREKNTALLFRALGQVNHLLQDMAQPQHTRNDRHGGCALIGTQIISGERSWYEFYIDTRAKTARFRSRGDPSPPLVLGGYPPPPFLAYDQFWTNGANSGLADFSSRNFFTAGTNLSVFETCGGFTQPPCRPDAYTRQDTPFSFVTIRGTTIAGQVTLFLRTMQDPVTGTTIPNVPITSRSAWDQHLERKGFFARFTLNTLNYDAISDVLLPRATGYAAGLLDYFFRGRLTAFNVPNAPGQARLRNLSKEALSGQVRLYADAPDGTRRLLFDFGNLSLAARGQPGDTSAGFSVPVSAGQPLTLVFQGRLGQEDGAVVGRALRPRLAFTGDTCRVVDPASGQCRQTVLGLHRWDGGPPGKPATVTALSQRETGETFTDQFPAWSPDGSQLAFASNKASADVNQFTLWLMDADGRNRRQATLADGITRVFLDGRPAWSPDGTRIAFSRRTGTAAAPEAGLFGQRDLFLYDLTAGTVQRLTGANRDPQLTLYDLIQPAWRPDGTQLVVASVAGGQTAPGAPPCFAKALNYELRLLALDGTPGPWLTCHPEETGQLQEAVALNPAWTSDGQAVIFAQTASTAAEAGTDLWLVRPADPPTATTKVPARTRLTQGVADDPVRARPTVAPDGKSVALSTGSGLPPQIFTFDRTEPPPVTSAEVTCLTCDPAFGLRSATHPAWSPGLP